MTRARVLEVARRLFARDGYAAVSRADVAREVGCGMSTVYYHFPEKQDLLLALIDEWGKAMPIQRRAALDIGMALSGRIREAAAGFLRGSYGHLRKGGSFYRVILTEAARDPEVRRRYEGAQQTITTWMSAMIRFGQEGGVLRRELDPEATAFLLHHVIESALTELASQKASRELDERVLGELAEMIGWYLTGRSRDPEPGAAKR